MGSSDKEYTFQEIRNSPGVYKLTSSDCDELYLSTTCTYLVVVLPTKYTSGDSKDRELILAAMGYDSEEKNFRFIATNSPIAVHGRFAKLDNLEYTMAVHLK